MKVNSKVARYIEDIVVGTTFKVIKDDQTLRFHTVLAFKVVVLRSTGEMTVYIQVTNPRETYVARPWIKVFDLIEMLDKGEAII